MLTRSFRPIALRSAPCTTSVLPDQDRDPVFLTLVSLPTLAGVLESGTHVDPPSIVLSGKSFVRIMNMVLESLMISCVQAVAVVQLSPVALLHGLQSLPRVVECERQPLGWLALGFTRAYRDLALSTTYRVLRQSCILLISKAHAASMAGSRQGTGAGGAGRQWHRRQQHRFTWSDRR